MDLYLSLLKIYRKILLHELKLINTEFKSTQITYNSLLYLDLIMITEDCTISYIADSLNIAKSSVTLKVKELEKQGLVYKEQSHIDKRQFYLRLSEKTKELGKIYKDGFANAIERIKRSFTIEERTNFINVVELFEQSFLNESIPMLKENYYGY